MNRLEQRYRRVLRLLPDSYRREWGDEMVTTFLERMHTGDPDEDEERELFGRPPLSERASVVGLAVRLRFGGVEAPPRSLLWGQAVRQAVLVGLLVLAVGGVWNVLFDLLLPFWPGVPADLVASLRAPGARSGVRWAGGLLWLVAFVTLASGWRRAAKVGAGAAFLLAIADQAWRLYQTIRSHEPLVTQLPQWISLAVIALLVAAMGAFHRDAPRVRPSPWLLGFAAGLVLTVLANLGMSLGGPGDPPWVDWWTIWSVTLIVAASIHLSRRSPGQPQRAAAWALAISLLAGPLLVLRLGSLVYYGLGSSLTWTSPALLLGFIEAGGVLIIGLWAGSAASRTLDALPEAGLR